MNSNKEGKMFPADYNFLKSVKNAIHDSFTLVYIEIFVDF